MKLCIAGSRTLKPSFLFITSCIKMFSIKDINEIVSGCAQGVDESGENWAQEALVNVKEFPADWETHGKAAGPIRNKQMASYSDCLLLIWDGSSKGSANCRNEFEKLGKPIYEVILKTNVTDKFIYVDPTPNVVTNISEWEVE